MRLAQRFREHGHELYLVGGPVRDMLLGRSHSDLDFATDAAPEQTKALVQPVARNLWLQGEAFGTIGAEIEDLHVEITTFRTERYEPMSRHPEVDFTSDITTDLSRRDFTINAMALRLPEKEAVDPFDGVSDLRARCIRTPIDPQVSFTDDPLRMLRAFRFASQLGFAIEGGVLATIARLKGQLETISAERIRDELSKLLVGEKPARALEQAAETGITDVFLPELSALKLEQDPVQKHKDVFHHTLAVLEQTPPELKLRLAALLHDIGKPKTREITPAGVSFHHHEVVGSQMAAHRLRELRYPNEVVADVSQMIYLHHRFHTYRLGWSDAAVRRYVRDAGSLLGDLDRLVRADCTTRNTAKAKQLALRMDELEERIAELASREELASIRPDLDGFQVMAYLGTGGGPVVGEALEYLLELRMEHGPLGADAAYEYLDRWARARGIEPAGERVDPKPKKSRDPA
ncbi:MAG: poly(A) polymerase [Actinomycetota bacterium]|jgi:poly(A) polymerase|nr:poly(A) polymerase [Actinomycetota bacterium]